MIRLTIDDLEMLNPDELGELLLYGVQKTSPDIGYIQDLLDVGCPVDAKNEFSSTALHYAARYGDLEVVKLLISNGADVNAGNIDNWTALHIAALYKNLEILKFLVSKGADVNARDVNGQTPLAYLQLGISS